MVARWYRPPEIILDHYYDQKVDVWSLGCVFAELAYVYQNKEKEDTSKRFLFKGTSCYPHSPKEMKQGLGQDVNISSNDQLIKIIETLGVLITNDLEFLDEASMIYVKNLNK